MIDVSWDAQTFKTVDRLLTMAATWDTLMHHDLAAELSSKALEYMKPQMHVRTTVPNTGALESSLRSQTSNSDNGFDVDFYGLFYGLYIDEGNDNLGEAWAANYGLNAFPADYRLGEAYAKPLKVIHPMGSYTPGVPNHYSDKTVNWLANDNIATDAAKRYIDLWIGGVVM